MTKPLEYDLDERLQVSLQAARTTRRWRQLATAKLGWHPPTSFYRVLLLMRLTPHTQWQPDEVGQRAALHPATAELVLERMARKHLVVSTPDGYQITDLGKAAAELR